MSYVKIKGIKSALKQCDFYMKWMLKPYQRHMQETTQILLLHKVCDEMF